MFKKSPLLPLVCVSYLAIAHFAIGADTVRRTLAGHVPPPVQALSALGEVPANDHISLAIGLPLRNETALDRLIRQLYDPSATNYHKFLTSSEFTSHFGPTEADYEAVIRFCRKNGFRIQRTYSNRLVLDVESSASNVEQAFQVKLHTYRHPTEARTFYAPGADPSVPVDVPIKDIWGLSDYARPTPLVHRLDSTKISPMNYNGTGPGGSYQGMDFRNAYAPGTTLSGSGQIGAVAEFDGYYTNDITTYEANSGYTNVPLQNVLLNGVSGTPGYSGVGNAVVEVSLDIELLIAMAPGLNQLTVYEGNNPYSVFSQIASDNTAKQISCSWSWGSAPTQNWASGKPGSTTLDSVLKQMVTQGQSFFEASGDSDAYSGSEALSTTSGPIPVDSIYVTSVGGTSLSMSGSSWSSETVWNWGNNTGSGGGISPNYSIPSWQTNVSMALNGGSTVNRNIPDVALTADAINVIYNNGSSGTFGGTSCAAPLWAGFTALVNQQSAAFGGAPVGFLNPAIYSLAAGTNYSACFHDITTGNNVGTNTPGLYNAVSNYDLATGLGTPNGTNLINALAPLPTPSIGTQPSSQTVTIGANVSFSVLAGGQSPLSYRWLLNGTNLPSGGNVSGTTSNTLTLTSVTIADNGGYSVVVTNTYGATTSSVATLTVIFPPAFTTQPTNQTVLAGSSVVFSANISGAAPVIYQWQTNGFNLVDGGTISGATSNVLTLSAVTASNAGNYTLVATNIYGAATSSVAVLTVLSPPTITIPPSVQTIQCGSNASFSVTAAGTPPLQYQWSLDSSTLSGATSTSLALTNVHLPNHTVTVVVTNLYGSATSSVPLTVQDTLAPVITLLGTNPSYVELGSAYVDPGATAYDLCGGIEPVTTNGTVNANVLSTNTVTYSSIDSSGNTASAIRTVIIRDTTPPTISWSFTNLVLSADANCAAAMPDVTGTNYIEATDLSGALTISQSPTNNALLALGTNTVVITVADSSGNNAYSTNQIVVVDQTPPGIALIGSDPMTNELGAAFTDPGVTASDNCSGVVSVTTNGVVDVNVVGTNVLTYVATDAAGNTNSVTRQIVVMDSMPPTILWSFTNLVLALDANCSAAMPDVTGTNFILATDLSGVAMISQAPTNGAPLSLGTNAVVISLADPYGNTAYSTNQIVVQDQTPPAISIQPQDETNAAGASAIFNVAASACTPLAYQWYFNNAALNGPTNSTLTLSNLSSATAGNYFAVATASGGSTTSAVAVLTVTLNNSSLAINSSSNPAGFKDSVNFTATVAPVDATGTVQFLTNGVAFDLEPLTNGTAISSNLLTLPRGTNFVTAIYSGDDYYQSATNSLSQIITNHPPIVSPAFYKLVAGSSLTIAVPDLATNWNDVDGDALSIVAISPSTNGVMVTNAFPDLFYSNSNQVNDQFVCAISDGYGGTNFQAVNITIMPSPTPLISGITTRPGGAVTLSLGGASGYTYILESSTDLISGVWQMDATNTIDSTGMWQFTDEQATNYTQRFYRLQLAP